MLRCPFKILNCYAKSHPPKIIRWFLLPNKYFFFIGISIAAHYVNLYLFDYILLHFDLMLQWVIWPPTFLVLGICIYFMAIIGLTGSIWDFLKIEPTLKCIYYTIWLWSILGQYLTYVRTAWSLSKSKLFLTHIYIWDDLNLIS